MTTKFKPLEVYERRLAEGYRLLPFRFTALDSDRYVLSNEAGQFVVLPRSDLADFVHHRLAPTGPTYERLKSAHFLIDADSTVAIDLLALKVRTKLSRIAQFTALHIFVTTLRCEHSCPYCQVSRRSDDRRAFDMSIETANRAVAMVFRSPSPAIKIEFQGGESLLAFDVVKHVVERAEDINRTECRGLQFVIATNLALLDDEILRYCRDHDILISTSLDGPADLHNRNRPRPDRDSYERTIAGIKKAREVLGRDRVSALMTTTAESLVRVREIIDEYLAAGFNGIFLRPLSPYGFAMKTKSYASYDVDRWLNFYFEGLEYILDINRNGHFFVEQYAAMILTKILTPFDTGYVDLRSPAGIGIGSIVYNYDGDVYASDEGRMLAEMGDRSFRIGNVHRDSWEEIVTSEALLEPLEASFASSVPMCVDCAFEPFCGAEPVFHHATQGDAIGHKPTSAFCKRNMSIFRYIFDALESGGSAKSIFTSWVSA